MQELKEVGLKVTLPRKLILELIAHSPERHLSAEEIHQRLSDTGKELGIATVYRVLTQLEEAGLVRRNYFSDNRAVYELNESGHHDHLICVSCGRVEEFYNASIEALQAEIAGRHGYRMVDHRLTMYGQCIHCQTQENTACREPNNAAMARLL